MVYAVHRGYQRGVFDSWDTCKPLVNRFPGAAFKKFQNRADAEYFVKHGETRPQRKLTDYFRILSK